MAANLYPLFLDLHGKPVLVVGAGAVAERKIASLIACNAQVTVVAPDAAKEIRDLAEHKRIRWKQRPFEDADVDGMRLVVAAAQDRVVNEAVAGSARKKGLWVNVVDMPDLCDFFVPAVVDRSPFMLAISTGGASPGLARRIRKELEDLFPERMAGFFDLVLKLRGEVRSRNPAQLEEFGTRVASSKAFDLWFSGEEKAARKVLRDDLDGLLV